MRPVNGKSGRQAGLFASEPAPGGDDLLIADAHGPDAGPAIAVDGPFAGVVFNRPVDQVFSYRIPPRLGKVVVAGQRVRVPLGRGNTPSVGYCVAVTPTAEVNPNRIKDVLEVLDDPPLIDRMMLDLTRWMARYYACTWGQALDAVVPAGVKKQAGTRVWTCLTLPETTRNGLLDGSLRLPTKQAEILEVVARAEVPLTIADVCKRARVGTGPVLALRKNGLLHTIKRRMGTATEGDGEPTDAAPRVPLELTIEQKAALTMLAPALRGEGGFATFLLHGVTGSGKTEIYLGAIDQVVARGREAIVLVPEISLTPQTIRRFKRRFPRVAVLHSHLSEGERHRHWRSIANGEVQVVVGARSAIFAPTRRLGLIVIDEEHESSFKQETVPRYHARDVAVKRAQLEGVPVILGSATPALETWRNATTGRYTRISLRSRVGSRPMPAVTLVDMRYEKPPGVVLSTPLKEAMTAALDAGGQVILLLNRRGFNTFAVCVNPKCRAVLKCRHCGRQPDLPPGAPEAGLPLLRQRDRPPPRLPGMPEAPPLRRARDRAAGARGGRGLPDPVDPPDGLRHDAGPREPRTDPGGLQGRRGGDPPGHADDRQGARLPPTSRWSASSTPIPPCTSPTSAPPSGRSRSSRRLPAAPAAARSRAESWSRLTAPRSRRSPTPSTTTTSASSPANLSSVSATGCPPTAASPA